MNYFVTVIVLCAAIGLSEQGLSKPEVDQMLDAFLEECAKKEGGTADDIKFLKDRNLPATKEQNCMAACIAEGFDFIANGKLKVDKVTKLAGSVLANQPEKIDIIIAIANECEDGKDGDRCQASHNIYGCGIKSAEKHGFNLQEFI